MKQFYTKTFMILSILQFHLHASNFSSAAEIFELDLATQKTLNHHECTQHLANFLRHIDQPKVVAEFVANTVEQEDILDSKLEQDFKKQFSIMLNDGSHLTTNILGLAVMLGNDSAIERLLNTATNTMLAGCLINYLHETINSLKSYFQSCSKNNDYWRRLCHQEKIEQLLNHKKSNITQRSTNALKRLSIASFHYQDNNNDDAS